MKHLNTYITEYIIKKKLDKPIDSEVHYKYYPQSKEELVKNIKELIKNDIYNFNCIDTSEITDMSHLFEYIDIDRNFDVSRWNVSNIENMYNMFYGCKNFNCDLSNWNISNVTNMRGMFYNCKIFEGKGLEKWHVHNVENMSSMFMNCINFNGDLSGWDVSKLENMSYIFNNCKKFNENLSGWNVSKITNMMAAFYCCENFTGNVLENWDVSNV